MEAKIRTLLLLSAVALGASQSSYAELIQEDNLGLSTLEKNARAFLREIERRGDRRLTQEEMRSAYASRVDKLRALEKETGQPQVSAIRDWVKAVSPILNDVHGPTARYDVHGPLHKVLESASLMLGREYDSKNHPFKEAKVIVPEVRKFTEAIVRYWNSRKPEAKEEL